MSKKILLSVHLAYWFYYMVITEFINDLAYKKVLTPITDYLDPLFISNLLLFTCVFYFNYFILLPHLFKKKKFLLLILYWIFLAIIFTVLRFFIQEYLFLKYLNLCNYCYDDLPNKWPIYAVNNFFQGLSNLILPGTVIWFIDNWLRSEKHRIQLQKEKVDAERAFLQAQVSPHFLFNSLNNIYSMVYHGSEDALPAIQKLSGLMRYIISESYSGWIELSQELAYLDDYIRLQQFRFNNAAVQFTVEGNPEGKFIAPLVLIAFVENAFKHGIINSQSHPVIIKMEIKENNFLFFTRNKINLHTKDSVSGIGLKNIESRLSLQYPGMHTLEIKQNAEFFEVLLSIDTLKTHPL